MVHGGQGQLAGRPRTTPMQYPWRGAASLARHGSKVIRGIIARKEGEARVPAEQIILETAAATLSFLLQHAYISVILHILWI